MLSPEQLAALLEIHSRPGTQTCSICRKQITGPIEVITTITSGPSQDAHFYCFYPHGVDDHSRPISEGDFTLLTRLSPERARFFYGISC
jgi:hypothetical protein